MTRKAAKLTDHVLLTARSSQFLSRRNLPFSPELFENQNLTQGGVCITWVGALSLLV